MKRLLIILPLVLAGCSLATDRLATENDEKLIDVQLSLPAKAGSASDVTYRALLLHTIGNTLSSGLYTGLSGSYRQKDPKEWMTPCEVDTDGIWIADDGAYGLRAPHGGYALCLASPAKKPDWLVYEASRLVKAGYTLQRDGAPISFSKAYNVEVGGNHLDREYVHQIPPERILREMRSKLTIKFRCGDDLEKVQVKEVRAKDEYSVAHYNMALDSLEAFTVDTLGLTIYPESSPQLELLNGAAPVTVATDFYLFSLDYSSIDEDYHYNYMTPKLVLKLGGGSVAVPFLHKMLPQTSYEYVLTINSAFVSFDLNIIPWEGASGQTPVVGPVESGSMAFDPGVWDEVDGGTGTIN